MRHTLIVALSLAALLLVAATTQADLAGLWSFDEGVTDPPTQTCADSSGHGLTGTLGSSAIVQAEDPAWGTSGEAALGDSCIICDHNQADWVSVPDPGDNSPLDVEGAGAKIHIQASIFPYLVGSDAVDYPVQVIVWKGSTSSTGSCNYSLDMHTSGGLTGIRFGLRDSTGFFQYVDYPSCIPDSGEWYVVSVDYDSSLEEDNCYIRVNGAYTLGSIFLDVGITMVADNTPLRIGRRSSTAFPLNGFHGRIDEVYLATDFITPAIADLRGLRAVRDGRMARIEWTCPATLGVFGFDLLRRGPDREAWTRLNHEPLLADESSLEPQRFTFADPHAGREPSYRLDAVYRNGQRLSYPVPIAKPEL
jgi:hypothetical protein